MWHIHKWSKWKIIHSFVGEYVWGGGTAFRLIQERKCEKCGKTERDTQDA